MNKEININYDDLASQVISKLADRLCNPEFIKNEIRKKFSEDLRLTMIGHLEDMDMSLVTTTVIDAMSAALRSENFMNDLIEIMTYRSNIGCEDVARLARSLVTNSDIVDIIDHQTRELKDEIDELKSSIRALEYMISQLTERGS